MDLWLNLRRSRPSRYRWFWPELLRLKGQLLRGEGSVEAAEDYLRQAIAGGRPQGALFWELRAATQLADLHCQSGRPDDGLEVLQPVFQQFTEHFETPDLEAARTVLAQCNRIQHRGKPSIVAS